MKRFAIVMMVLTMAPAAVHAEKLDLRWIPRYEVTGVSGKKGEHEVSDHIRLNATMSGDLNDRQYAFRGITIVESGDKPCGIILTPAFLDGDANKNVELLTWGGCNGSKQTAELPAGYFVNRITVCTNGEDDGRIKGIEIGGATVDARGKVTEVSKTAKFERPNCRKWFKQVKCPAGTIAPTFAAYNTGGYYYTGIKLDCTPVETEQAAKARTVEGQVKSLEFSSSDRLSISLDIANRTYDVITLRAWRASISGTKCSFSGSVAGTLPTDRSSAAVGVAGCNWEMVADAPQCTTGSRGCEVTVTGSISYSSGGKDTAVEFSEKVTLSKFGPAGPTNAPTKR